MNPKILYGELTELGVRCGLFYVGSIRCSIIYCADVYWIVSDTHKTVLSKNETQAEAWADMDRIRARFRGVAV